MLFITLVFSTSLLASEMLIGNVLRQRYIVHKIYIRDHIMISALGRPGKTRSSHIRVFLRTDASPYSQHQFGAVLQESPTRTRQGMLTSPILCIGRRSTKARAGFCRRTEMATFYCIVSRTKDLGSRPVLICHPLISVNHSRYSVGLPDNY